MQHNLAVVLVLYCLVSQAAAQAQQTPAWAPCNGPEGESVASAGPLATIMPLSLHEQ